MQIKAVDRDDGDNAVLEYRLKQTSANAVRLYLLFNNSFIL